MTPPTSSFAPTRWTMVLAAANLQSDTHSRRALAELSQQYWFPLYAYIRRQGHHPAQAEDLTQDFFARLLEKKSLTAVDRTKGKFRSFLLASLQNFLHNDHDKTHAQKRGGHTPLLALDRLNAEARYAVEPADDVTPERLFERRWAWAVLDQVLQRLQSHYETKGQQKLFEALKPSLTTRPSAAAHAQLARNLGMTEGALTVAAHRLRRRYRELLRNEIAQTVPDPALIDEEIRYLLNCL
jgi:DNA-directed RNA polymerase specialized sigma24 family protein